MLGAYFDDSGTHGDSVVSVAGILGTEWQIRSLENAWAKLLRDPLCGFKPSISRLHRADVQHRRGEFASYTRTEGDFLLHQFQTAILQSHVCAYGAVCSAHEYDEIIKGDIRSALGETAEQFCIRQCFIQAIYWAKNFTFDDQIAFIFDQRNKSIKRDAEIVYQAFQEHSKSPKVVNMRFESSLKFMPLQAADMISYEIYQQGKKIERLGSEARVGARAARIFNGMHYRVQFASKDALLRIKEFCLGQDPDIIRDIAEHFRNFDPYVSISASEAQLD